MQPGTVIILFNTEAGATQAKIFNWPVGRYSKLKNITDEKGKE